ncbi:MAG: UvrD-helicase domain-containing protein [Candidatus Protochlamydia sp.]|nr:UvrD-helicase domain-containing protein [Candidatus Protochlamydia sp.]
MNLSDLNSAQQDAVKILEGPALVLAGAGSGKTSVVTRRIAHLIESGVPASKILGLTFTNKAAQEMRERVTRLSQHQVLICTFHSLGARVLRECVHVLGYGRDFTIYDEEDVDKIIKACLVELGLKEKKMEAKPFRTLISKAKNDLLYPNEISAFDGSSDVEAVFPSVYALYQRKLLEYHAVDFDDLLFLTVKIWQDYPEILNRFQMRWEFVLIDEYQDTNEAQYTLAQLLVEKRLNLFVVGDPDQSIYSWRGAQVRNILNFERDFPGAKVVRLEQNYRSCTNILDCANALIKNNTNRFEKELWSDLGPGEKIKLFIGQDEREEAEFAASQISYYRNQNIPLREMVVFYRTNAQSRAFEDYLLYSRIPYVIIGGVSFYQRKEIKDTLAFLRFAKSGTDFVAFARTINLPKRGMGEATIEKLRQGANEEGLTLLAFCDGLLKDAKMKALVRLSAKQKEGLSAYMKVIHELRQLIRDESVSAIVIKTIEQTGYLEFLAEDRESFEERRENLNALIAKATEWEISAVFPTLESFLEELSLKSNLDEVDQTVDRLSLMTIHNGKGLEFKVTFLAGLEEDLFPHVNSINRGEDVEEERRLCYVGMTRAKEYLHLSFCHCRYLWGNLRPQRPSRFLKELPTEYIERVRHPKLAPKKYPTVDTIQRERMIYIEKPLQKNEEIFQIGDALFHKDFGIGQVKESYQGSMGLTYKILFTKDSSLRTLVAKYANLSRV